MQELVGLVAVVLTVAVERIFFKEMCETAASFRLLILQLAAILCVPISYVFLRVQASEGLDDYSSEVCHSLQLLLVFPLLYKSSAPHTISICIVLRRKLSI